MKLLPFSLFATPTRERERVSPVVPAAARVTTLSRQRVLLLIGSGLLLATPLALLAPGAHWAQDPELFRLLRGMGTLKFLLAAVAFAVVWWRLGRPVTPGLRAIYVGGVCTLALATGLIWQLNLVLPASGLFHLATLALLVAAWRDIEPRFGNDRVATRRGAARGTDTSA